MATPPTLGYGTRGEAPIDAVNQWMRGQPWYQQLLQSFGQDPRNVHLSDDQKQRVIQAAQAHGVVVDEGHNGQEVDDSGNFQAKSHALRNTLIVVGIAAAALATAGAAGAFAGGAAAGGSGAAAGGGAAAAAAGGGTLAATTTVPLVGSLAAGGVGLGAASTAAISTAAATVGTTAATAAATKIAAAGGAITVENILKYAVPVAGNLVGGLIQAKATGAASDAQQKYLEEALAYQKEQDAYARTTDASRYADTRSDRAAALALEASRYGDYQGRIAPWIANGTTSNDRMAALLGLPARSGSSSGGSGGGGSPGDPLTYADRLSSADKLKIDALLKASDSNDDPRYWYGINAQHGGFDATGADWNARRIATGDGVGKGYTGPSAPSAPSAPPAAPTLTTQPLARSADVPMRAPDGSIKTVPADQVEFYRQRGATPLQGAA